MYNCAHLVAPAIGLLAIALIIFTFFKLWSEDLVKREANLKRAIAAHQHERAQGIHDHYIFCSLWRPGHILRRAQALGMVIDLVECAAVVASVRAGFTPDEGLTFDVIDAHLRKYVATRVEEQI